MIELYHWEPVSHSLRVLICLNEIGVAFRSHYVDLLEFEQFGEDFLAMNPAGQVPVLKNNGVAMCESALINEYLAEAFPEAGLAATDPLGWYGVQSWSKFVDYNLSSSVATLGCSRYLVPHLSDRDPELMRQAVGSIPVAVRQPGWTLALDGAYPDELLANSERKVGLVVSRMEKILDASDWLAGNEYSIADINTFAMIHALRDLAASQINERSTPHVEAWHGRIAGRKAVKTALATAGKFTPGRMYAPGPEHSRWG